MQNLRRNVTKHLIPATVLVLTILCGQVGTSSAAVLLPSPGLPPEPNPIDCAALASQFEGTDVFALFPGGIDLSDVQLGCFQNVNVSSVAGLGETQTFDAVLTGVFDSGSGPQPVTLMGPMTMVAYNKFSATGSWQVEIVSMSLSGDVGGVPIELRQSPGQPSLSQTTVADLGGGVYEIDSFFDIFPELSVAGGPFQPSLSGPGRLELVAIPAPPSVPSIGPLAVSALMMSLTGVGLRVRHRSAR
jgi:hypothetical protein